MRLLTSTFGVLTTLVLYFAGKQIGGQKIGLFASAIFAVYPVAVIQNRWGYSYNQLMFLAALSVCYTLKYVQAPSELRRTRWLVAAAFVAAMGMVTDQEGSFVVVGVLIATLTTDRRKLASTAAVALAPPALYAIAMLILIPSEFLYDWQHNLGRVNDANVFVMGIKLGMNYNRFLAFDYWLPLGMVGIFLIPNKRARITLVLFSVAALFLTRNFQELTKTYLVPFSY